MLFHRLVWVSYCTNQNRSLSCPSKLTPQNLRSIHLHIDKLAPWLKMPGEAFHEAGIAVSAPVFAPHVGVDAVVVSLNTGFREEGFG